jgi:hypothetical protein
VSLRRGGQRLLRRSGSDVEVIAPLERLRFRDQGLGFRGVDAEGFPATRRGEVAD